MPGKCLYCYKETGQYEGAYHIACSQRVFKSYPPPALPFTAQQISAVNAQAQVYFTRERKQKTMQQSRLLPAPQGDWQIITSQTRPVYNTEADDLLLKLAGEAGINTLTSTLLTDTEGELVLLKKSAALINLSVLSKVQQPTEGSYLQVIKAIEKYSHRPGLDKIEFTERLLFGFLIGYSGINWQTVLLEVDANGKLQLAPFHFAQPTAILQPAIAIEMDLLLGGKRTTINEATFNQLIEKAGVQPKVWAVSIRKFSRVLRVWFSTIENSFLPGETKRALVRLILQRAERLGVI